MSKNLRILTATAIGIALFVVLALCLQVPVFENYYLCLGYVAMAVYCYSFGTVSGTVVGALGVVLYCLIINGMRGMPGWALGNMVIGVGLGLAFAWSKKLPSKPLKIAVWAAAVVIFTALGILGVKSLVDSFIRAQPFLVRAGMNLYAFVADVVVLLVAVPLCAMLDKPAQKLLREIIAEKVNYTTDETKADTRSAPDMINGPASKPNEGDYITITGYEKDAAEILAIPVEIEGLPVKEIGNWAFCNKKISQFTIPASVTKIGSYAIGFQRVGVFTEEQQSEHKYVEVVSDFGDAEGYDPYPDVTILGQQGSEAQRYAFRYGFRFQLQKKEKQKTTESEIIHENWLDPALEYRKAPNKKTAAPAMKTNLSPGAAYRTAIDRSTIPAQSAPKAREADCPFSPGIRYSVTGDSMVRFVGTGILQGKYSFDPDDPNAPFSEGIHSYSNCIGEDIGSSVDWGSERFILTADYYNPNHWCMYVLVEESITEIGPFAFHGFDALKQLTIKGKNTKITDWLPLNITICAPP